MLSAKFLLAATLIMSSPLATAEEHPLGDITGTQIDLKVYDHTIAGSVRDFVIWGSMDHDNFTSELLMRRDGQTVRATFGQGDDERTGGTITHTTGDNRQLQTSIWFASLDRNTNTYTMTVNDASVLVKVEGEDFQNNHFINPTYTATFADGREFSFRMQGEACYGYSLHLIMMILGAWAH